MPHPSFPVSRDLRKANSIVIFFFQGVVIFGITVNVQTLAIRLKGPVFMTAFKPLSTLIVAIMGLLILGDALYIGG